MRKPFLLALTGLALVACGPSGDPPATPDAGGGDGGPCQIKSAVEGTPGSPFNVNDFKTNIWPDLVATCGLSGCHKAGAAGATTFNIWSPDDAECPDVQSFNAFYDRVDFRTNVANSLLLKNMDGSDAHVPPYADSPLLPKFRAFVQAGFDAFNGGGPGGDLTGYFDEDVFATQIQPLLDSLSCTTSGCHNTTDNAGNLGLTPNPAAGSAELKANFAKMTTYVSQDSATAQETTLYFRATDKHRGFAFADGDLSALQDWIQDALDLLGGPGGNPVLCAPEAAFNVGVFRDEILPMLQGRVDWNDIDSGRTSTGCARSECHGRNRGPGTFFLDPNGTPEDNINSLRCFLDLTNPSASQALLCPLNLSGCNKRPHPGSDIFFGVDDLNYQKLLAFAYATKNGATPLDFAFFVRKINPIFNDPNAVQDAALGLTCASSSCHRALNGVADNGSNFPIFPEATDPADLFNNFISAANFTHFPQANQSSLFLYPTNEVANQDNPLATGLNHPGGKCFEVDDVEAIDILKFAGGLRPNAEAFAQDFLVAGLFAATDVTDDALFNEETVEPKIFDRSGQGQQFNQGLWDGFFSPVAQVNLLDAFQVADAAGTLAYAVLNVVNTTSNELDVVVNVLSENDVELFVGDDAGDIGRDGDGVSSTVRLPSFNDTKEVTRVMLKVFQQADEATFGFTMQFTDDENNLLTDATKELVFVLAKNAGGI
jgi:hypothetical protein